MTLKAIPAGNGARSINPATNVLQGPAPNYRTRTDSCTLTSGSSVVIDASILVSDMGCPISGSGVPANSFVSAVAVGGGSFVLSSSPSQSIPVNATSTGTSSLTLAYQAPVFAFEDISSLYLPLPGTPPGSPVGHQKAYGPQGTPGAPLNGWNADVLQQAIDDPTYTGANVLTSPQSAFTWMSINVYAKDLWPSPSVFHARDTGHGGDGVDNMIDAALDYANTMGISLWVHLFVGTSAPAWWSDGSQTVPNNGAAVRDSGSKYTNCPQSNSQTPNLANPCPVWWHPEMYKSASQNGGTAGLYYDLMSRVAALYDNTSTSVTKNTAFAGIVVAGPMTVFPEPMARDLAGLINARTDSGCAITNGSSVVADTNIGVGDKGRPVKNVSGGSGIPTNAYVGTVSPGVGYVLSSSATTSTPLNATATNANISLVLSASAPTSKQILTGDGGSLDASFNITQFGSFLKGTVSAPVAPELDGTFVPITLTDTTGTHTYPYGLYQDSFGGLAATNDVLSHYWALKAHTAIFTTARQQYACNPYASLIGTTSNVKYLDANSGVFSPDLGNGPTATWSTGGGGFAFDSLGTTFDLARAARKINANIILSNESARFVMIPGGPADHEWEINPATGKMKMFDANSYTSSPSLPGSKNLQYPHMYIGLRRLGPPYFQQTASTSTDPTSDRMGAKVPAWLIPYMQACMIETPSAYSSVWTGVKGTRRSDPTNPNAITYNGTTGYQSGNYVIGANGIPYKLGTGFGPGAYVGTSHGAATDPSQDATNWLPFPGGILPIGVVGITPGGTGQWTFGGAPVSLIQPSTPYNPGDHVLSVFGNAYVNKKKITATPPVLDDTDDPSQDSTHWKAATDCILVWTPVSGSYPATWGWWQPYPQTRSAEFSPYGYYTQTVAMQANPTTGSGSSPPLILMPTAGSTGGGGGPPPVSLPTETSQYPTALDVFTSWVRPATRWARVLKKTINAVQQVQKSLGVNPQGIAAPDVATRISNIENTAATVDTSTVPAIVIGTAGSPGISANAAAQDHVHELDPALIGGGGGGSPLTGVQATATANAALVVSKHNPIDCSSSNLTMTLPTGSAPGTMLSVERIDFASANTCTISGNVRGVGATSITLLAPSPTTASHESLVLLADSTGSWWPISGHKTKSWLDATYPAVDVQVFSSSGTWTKPVVGTPKVVQILLQAPGCGGGSGARTGTGVVATGGGSGGGGAKVILSTPASACGATESVTIGAVGAGGGAVTVDSTAGSNGTTAGSVTFGTHARAQPGSAGGGGQITAVAGTAGSNGKGGFDGGSGQASSATGAAGGTPSSPSGGAAGGGAGGGITTGNVASNGGDGAKINGGSNTSFGAGGVVDTTAPTTVSQATGSGEPAGGGGGGASSITTAAQAGAAGGNYGAGGGGGGASRNGNNSGAGGAGGPGYAIVITYF